MKRLRILAVLLGVVCMMYSCAGSRRTKITTLTPNTANPSQGVKNASGDALTIGIPNGNDLRAGSSENATAIANNAIAKVNAPSADAQIRLDSLRNVDFINKAAVSGMVEITRSKAIQAQAANKGIKEYASTIMNDHTRMKVDLNKLASNKNVVLMSAKTSEKMPASDAEYINMMIEDHQTSIRAFEGATKSQDPEIKAFASKYLPVLRKHLAAAQALSK